MKNQILIFVITFFVESLLAQQKGVSPLSTNNQQLSTNTYAVVVGISDYQDPAIPDLQFADRDAEAFANYLRSTAGSPDGSGLDEDHLKVLINSQATMAQFANVLDWLMESAKEGDQAIIYFSGHGDVEKKTLTQPGFLLCWDAPARVYMAGGAFNLRDIQEVVSTLSIQNKSKVIVITDACRSGKLAGSSVGGSQATASNLAKQFANEIKIMSCQPDEYSIEGEQWGGGRGAFSYHLVDALYGLADNNNDQWITLYEVGRYLEDHVTSEVAPISQLPMVLGNRNEKINSVDAKLLAEIKSGKLHQRVMLTPIESKGIEEEVLSGVDSTIKVLYQLFKKVLKDKLFFEPKNACADSYYEKLINEAGLTRLHSTMKRNYAAALQDDAQQAINIWLTADIKKLQCIGASLKLEPIPHQLERAAQLLGEGHYMFKALKGRQYLFEGIVIGFTNWIGNDTILGRRLVNLFNRSLEYEPNSPLAHSYLMNLYGITFNNLDSAQIYLENANQLAPSWVLPFNDFYWTVAENNKPGMDELGKAILDRAMSIDSAHGMVLDAMGNWLKKHRRFEEALVMFKRYIISGGDTYPCWFNNITTLLMDMNKPLESKAFIENIIALDSTSESAPMLLTNLYLALKDHANMKITLEKYLPLFPDNPELHYFLGRILNLEGQYEKAIPHFEFVIKKTPLNLRYNNAVAEIMLGEVLLKLGRRKEAEFWFNKVINSNSNTNDPFTFNYTARSYLDLGMMEKFYELIKKVTTDLPNNESIEYQVACLYSIAGMPTEALHWLEMSMIHSQSKTYLHYEMDFDMDNIYGTNGFNELIKKYFPDRFKN